MPHERLGDGEREKLGGGVVGVGDTATERRDSPLKHRSPWQRANPPRTCPLLTAVSLHTVEDIGAYQCHELLASRCNVVGVVMHLL